MLLLSRCQNDDVVMRNRKSDKRKRHQQRRNRKKNETTNTRHFYDVNKRERNRNKRNEYEIRFNAARDWKCFQRNLNVNFMFAKQSKVVVGFKCATDKRNTHTRVHAQCFFFLLSISLSEDWGITLYCRKPKRRSRKVEKRQIDCIWTKIKWNSRTENYFEKHFLAHAHSPHLFSIFLSLHPPRFACALRHIIRKRSIWLLSIHDRP